MQVTAILNAYMRGANIPHKPVLIALAVGTVLVVLALVIGRSETIEESGGEIAVVTRAPERNYVQVEDADENGIPDWQEALVRVEPFIEPVASSSDWQPTTMTEGFTVSLIEHYMRNKTYGPLGRDQSAFVSASVEGLNEHAADIPVNRLEIMVLDQNDTETLRSYGNSLVGIMNKYPVAQETETVVLERALRTNDESVLKGIEPILNSYRGMVVDMKMLPVPSSYADEHLALTNSYQSIANDLEAAMRTFSDPALSLVRMKRYPADVALMSDSIVKIINKLISTDKVPFTKSDEFTTILPREI